MKPTRTIQHDGREYERKIQHDKRTNRLFVEIDGKRWVVEAVNPNARPPVTCKTVEQLR